MDPEEEIVRALKRACVDVTGEAMNDAGTSGISDVNRLVPIGGIPAVAIGLDGDRAHADYEFARLEKAELGCRIAMQTAIKFLGGAV